MGILSLPVRQYQRKLLDTVVKHNPSLGLDQRAEYFVSLFEKHLPPASEMLDIGGGWGFYKEPLENRGHHTTVIDVVQPGFQKAPVVVYDGQRLPFDDDAFDVSMFITVLHHINDLEQVVKEARRVTRRKLIVVEDVYHHGLGRLWTIFRDMIYNFEFFGHPCNFKKKSDWVSFFESQRFSLVDYQQVYTWLSGLRILNGVFVFEVEKQ